MKSWQLIGLLVLAIYILNASAQTCLSNDECVIGAWDPDSEQCIYQVLTGSPCDVGRACYTSGICQENGECSSQRQLCEDNVPTCYESFGCNEQLNMCDYRPVNPGTSCDTGDFCEVDGQCNNLQQCIGVDRDCSQNSPCSVSICDEDEDACVIDYYVPCVPEQCDGLCTYPEQSWAEDPSAWNPQHYLVNTICDATWEYWMLSPSLDNAWIKLMREYIAYRLNVARGCCNLTDINNMADMAYEILLNNCSALSMQQIAPYYDTLRDYNTGVSGPGQCLDDIEVLQCQNGIPNCNLDSCDCYPGWAGEECDSCASSPLDGYSYICVPLPFENLTAPDLDDQVTYELRLVETEMLHYYLAGTLPSFGMPIYDDDDDEEPIFSIAPGTEGLACDCTFIIGKREINEQSDENDLVGEDMCQVWVDEIIQLQILLDETEEHCCLPLLDIDDDDDDEGDDEDRHHHCPPCEGDDDDGDGDCDDDDWWWPFLIVLILLFFALAALIYVVFIAGRNEEGQSIASSFIGGGMHRRKHTTCEYCHNVKEQFKECGFCAHSAAMQQQKQHKNLHQRTGTRLVVNPNI